MKTKIKCIANNDTTKGPEVPLWECPCKTCTRMEWKCECEYEETRTLKAHRHEKWPEFWSAPALKAIQQGGVLYLDELDFDA